MTHPTNLQPFVKRRENLAAALGIAEVVGVDAHRLRRIRRGQLEVAAAERAQGAGVQRVAVAGQAVAPVVVEHRRHEMELHVAAFVGSER